MIGIENDFPNDSDLACQEAEALNLLMAWCGYIGIEEYIDKMPAFHRAVAAIAQRFPNDEDIRQQKTKADEIFRVDATAVFR